MNVDDMTGQCVKWCRAIEQHMWNCECDLASMAYVGACGSLKGFDMTTVGATTLSW